MPSIAGTISVLEPYSGKLQCLWDIPSDLDPVHLREARVSGILPKSVRVFQIFVWLNWFGHAGRKSGSYRCKHHMWSLRHPTMLLLWDTERNSPPRLVINYAISRYSPSDPLAAIFGSPHLWVKGVEDPPLGGSSSHGHLWLSTPHWSIGHNYLRLTWLGTDIIDQKGMNKAMKIQPLIWAWILDKLLVAAPDSMGYLERWRERTTQSSLHLTTMALIPC